MISNYEPTDEERQEAAEACEWASKLIEVTNEEEIERMEQFEFTWRADLLRERLEQLRSLDEEDISEDSY